ncbi:serine threonine kinase [Fusarium albosuccineum]|uniref:Serine threonine kinase n=1 Tax=Fusarium albosuccineum TaxID=1237068 RepID=A0A8H4PKX0_9HYPO|nr:serine threonine kinase [Fusarium albosuccineum]
MASHASPLRTQSTSSRLDRDNRHREFIDFVRRSLRDGINGLDETDQFITPSVVRAWWTKPGEGRISNALNPRSYTSSDTILRGYTMVFSVLVYIGRTQFIGDFIRLRFGDRQLPLLKHDRRRFGDDPAMAEMLDDFYNNQWKFTPIIFSSQEGMNLTLIDDERQILPIKEQRSLPSTASNPKSVVRVVTLYPDCCPSEWGPQEYQTQKNEAFRKSWSREYNAFASIESCENVIKYLGSFEQNGRCFMMLEYADGGSLLDVFKRNVIPRTRDDLMRFWTALMGLFLAINRIYNLGKSSEGERTGFAHRDINPSNVLVFLGNGGPTSPFSEGFKLKLADFDTATTWQSIDDTELSAHDNHGTRTYCAPQAPRAFPQQERDIMQVLLGCDVWSLGCILSEALVWLAGGWEAIEVAARDRKMTIAREHPEMKGSGYDYCFHDGTHVLQCVMSSHKAAVNKFGHEDILSPKMCQLIEGLIFLPEDSRPLQYSPMNIWATFNTKIKGSIASDYGPTDSTTCFNDKPVSEPPNTLTPDGNLGPLGSSKRDKTLPPGGSPNPQSNPDLYPNVTVDDVIAHHQGQGKREDFMGYKSFKRSCKRRHFMIIIDDSQSMRKRLNEVYRTAEALLWILKDIDLELRFTSDPTRRHRGISIPIWRRSTGTLVRKIRQWFNANEADTFCNMELAITKIFNEDKVVDLKRPTSVLILTDGIWEGGGRLAGGGVEANITSVVRQMEKKEIPRTGFTIQFVSFGNDPAGISRLKYLDDDAPYQNKKGEKVDIVDHKTSKANVWHILLGAMSEAIDREPIGPLVSESNDIEPLGPVISESNDLEQPQVAMDAVDDHAVQFARPTGHSGPLDENTNPNPDVSYVSSVFKNYTSSTSDSSNSDKGNDPRQVAARTLAHYFFADLVLRDLYSEAIRNLGEDRFFAKHDRLLKIFLKDLRAAATDSLSEEALRFLSRKQSRATISSRIFDQISSLKLGQPAEPVTQGISSLDNLITQHTTEGEVAVAAPRNPFHEPLGDVSDDSEEEDAGDAEDAEFGGDPELQPGNAQQLERLVAFFTTGPAFATLKSNLACLVQPPTTIRAALDMQNLRYLKRLLRKRFDTVAQDEYLWLRELEDIGYSRDEIADLLFEEARDTPWIFFTNNSNPQPEIKIQVDHHIPGCVHQLFLSNNWGEKPVVSSGKLPEADMLASVTREIQWCCGLAGIVPSSRDREKWNGSVSFDEENSVAFISYNHPETFRMFSRLLQALELCCRAVSIAQAAGLCCQSFTILRQSARATSNDAPDREVIELCRIKLELVIRMLREFQVLALNDETRSIRLTATRELVACLGLQGLEVGSERDTVAVLQTGCLCVQILSVGFLFYIQGHVGPFQPFFLDTAVKKIHLLGCEMSPLVIEISLKKLSCIGEMLQGSVLVFDSPRATDGGSHSPDATARLDLFASPEDLVDTWGPAQFILPIPDIMVPSAIQIGGGVVFESGPGDNKFHWGRDVSSSQLCQGLLDPRSKIRIGTPPVSVNNTCQLNEGECWIRYSNFLRPLATFGPVWVLAERQVAVQAGMYVVAQANSGYHWKSGRTLKQDILSCDENMLSYLEGHWAVQVSLCTGIAKRVSLQEMVADLLPVFANELMSQPDLSLWEKLRDRSHIVEQFRTKSPAELFRGLEPPSHDLIMRLVSRILSRLGDTGLDRQGEMLRVSWPYGSDTSKCFEIDLRQHESSWARLIADSEDCATFIYASPKCLETTRIQCDGTHDDWNDAIPLLETAVAVCSVPVADAALRHEETYYFQKMGEMLFVKAVQSQTGQAARLIGRNSMMPTNFRHRHEERDTVRQVGEAAGLGGGEARWKEK